MKKKQVLLIGPYTAVGGVSIHIKRLSVLMKELYDFQFIDESPRTNTNSTVFNIRSKNLRQYFKLLSASDITHIHTGIWWLRCLHILNAFLLNKKSVVTVHSLSNLKNNFSIYSTRFFLLLADKTITVSEGVNKTIKPKDKYLIPAFIPPNIETEEKLPKEILTIINSNKEKKLIVSNAFKLVTHNQQDLYGLDLLINVAEKIKNQQKRYKIIFVVASVSNDDTLYKSYVDLIKENELETTIYLIPYPISFVNLMLKSDVVVRATNTDGDALTVRESLYLNRPIIASNITKRPEGTILFKNRDPEDLYIKLNKILEGKEIINKVSDTSIHKKTSYYQKLYSSIYCFEKSH